MANYTDNAVESAVLNDDVYLRVLSYSTSDSAVLNDDTTTRLTSVAIEIAVLNDAVFQRAPTLVFETAVLNDGVMILGSFRDNAVESATLNDASETVMRDNAIEVATLNDAVTLRVSSRTVDVAVLDDSAGGAQTLTTIVVEAAVLNDAARSVMVDKVSDAAVLNDAASESFAPRNLIVEVAILNDAATAFAFKVDFAEESAVLNDDTMQQLQGVDKVVEVAYLSDYARGGEGSAWRAHLEPMAMSRYDNYPFTSLAVVAGKLLGTGPGGVYLLEGATDAGSSIAAEIEQDWTDRVVGEKGTEPDPNLKRPRYVYLNTRVAGVLAFVLGCVEDGQEVEYDYSLPDTTASGFVNIRAPLGRGIRSRHIRPTIRNVAGADFEINDGRIVVDSLARSL